RGWYGWAGTRLDVSDASVVYHGPDGQVAAFARTTRGLLRHPAMEGDLAEVGDGFELRWKWTARFPGMTWSFDGGGRLLAVDDPFGGVTVAHHDENGRLARLTHQGGRQLTLRWTDHHVEEVVSSDGRRVVYRYDGDDLVGVERPAGAQRYAIGDDGRVAEVWNADGVRLVRNEYDADGRVLVQTSPFGRVSRYRYVPPHTVIVGDAGNGADGLTTLFRHDAEGRLVEMRRADGSRASRRFDEYGNPVYVVGFDGVATSREFDIKGNCVRELRPGGRERRFTHDDQGRLTRLVDEMGAEFRLSYEGNGPVPSLVLGPLGFERRFASDAGGLAAVVDSDGVSVRYERDAEGQVVAAVDGEGGTARFRYDRSGALIERVSPSGDVERWEVDDAGRPTAYISASGDRTERRLSPGGRPLSVTDGTGATCRFEWGEHGQPAALVDPLGETSRFAWDELGNKVGVSLPDGADWSFDFDPLGRLAGFCDPAGDRWSIGWAPNGLPASLEDPAGNGVHVAYDPAGTGMVGRSAEGRELEIRFDAAGRMIAGSADAGGSSCQVDRDVLGRITNVAIDGQEVARLTYTPGGRLATLSRADGASWQWVYDRAGRPVEISTPSGLVRVTYDASGRPRQIAAPDGTASELSWDPDSRLASAATGGAISRYAWDAAGRLLEEQEGEQPPRRYRYDPRGSLVEVVDPAGGLTRFAYNRRGALTAVVDPQAKIWTTERDGNDRMVATVDPLGRRTGVSLDAAGRVAALHQPDGETIHYRRNRDGLLDGVSVDARPVLSVDRDLSSRRTSVRDGEGRVTEVAVDGFDRVVSYRRDGAETCWDYDDERQQVTVTAPGLPPVVVHVGPDGNPVQLDVEGLEPVSVDRRDGWIVAMTCGRLQRRWDRDDAGRVIAYTEAIDGRERRTTLERDAAGRVVLEAVDGVERRYTYDTLGQLVSAAGPEGLQEWAYDGGGRLVAERSPAGERQFIYDDADQLVRIESSEGETTFTYDQRGRRIRRAGPDGATEYRWDALDRLTAVHAPDGAPPVEVAVDGLGQLVAVAGVAGGDLPGAAPGEVLRYVGGDPVVMLGGMPVASLPRGGAPVLLPVDWRGSVGDRDAWGAGRDRGGRDAGAALGWLGELELDGVVWLRHRVYDPQTHGFLSKDPVPGDAGVAGGVTNPYLYAYNDPLQWLDPLGLTPITAAEANQQMTDWKQGHWKELVVTAAAVAILIAAPEVGLPALIGGLASGAGTIGSDMLFHHGNIDWGEVIMNTATGAAFGAVAGPLAEGFAGALPGTTTDITETAAMDQLPQAARMAINTGIGGGLGASATASDSWATNQPITLESEAVGFAGGAAPGLIPTKTWADVMNPEYKQAMDSWMARHPNAVNLTRNGQRMLAAAKATAGFTNKIRTQPMTFLSGATGMVAGGAVAPPANPVLTPPPLLACPAAPPGFIGPVACR
ncbi:MAG: RHS repeat protein, partial [Acidimicrobiaceae bacterium]|nr:RHS repeat protein [Acidimicrobiaceae bacterium]